MSVDYSAPIFQGPNIRPGVWKAAHNHIKKKGIWTRGEKNDKGQLMLTEIVKRSCGSDDWWMDYYCELLAKVGYDPDHWASYERRSKAEILEFIRNL